MFVSKVLASNCNNVTSEKVVSSVLLYRCQRLANLNILSTLARSNQSVRWVSNIGRALSQKPMVGSEGMLLGNSREANRVCVWCVDLFLECCGVADLLS